MSLLWGDTRSRRGRDVVTTPALGLPWGEERTLSSRVVG